MKIGKNNFKQRKPFHFCQVMRLLTPHERKLFEYQLIEKPKHPKPGRPRSEFYVEVYRTLARLDFNEFDASRLISGKSSVDVNSAVFELSEMLKKFLAQRALSLDEELIEQLFIRELTNRGAEETVLHYLLVALRRTCNRGAGASSLHSLIDLLQYYEAYFARRVQKLRQSAVKNLLWVIEKWYTLQKMRFQIIQSNNERILKAPPQQLNLVPAKFIRACDGVESRYLELIGLLGESHASRLRPPTLPQKEERIFSHSEALEYRSWLLNCQIRAANFYGDPAGLHHLFELYRDSLRSQFYADGKYISFITFSNLIEAGLKAGKLREVGKLYFSNASHIKKVDQVELRTFFDLNYLFESRKYGECLEFIGSIQERPIRLRSLIKIKAKIIELKCYYELQDFGPEFKAGLRSLEHLIQELPENLIHKGPELRSWFAAFKLLVEAPEPQLVEDIQQGGTMEDKVWLLRKAMIVCRS